jgi:hypothetical protein
MSVITHHASNAQRRSQCAPPSREEAFPLAGLRCRQSQAHTAEERRILDLLRRGAGVTQILRETGKPGDAAADRLARASRLRCVLESLPAASDPHAPRRFTRTLAYLDHRMRLLQAEVKWKHHSRPSSVTTDSYGVQLQVQDGLPSFTMIGVRDHAQHVIGENLRKRLGTLWPERRITVVIPEGWTPSDLSLTALAHAIHVDDTY